MRLKKMSPQLGFKHTTHNRTIYQAVFNGHKVLLLRQVDDLMIQTDNEAIAKEIFNIIGLELQLENEDKPPFAYLGLTTDFNGVDIEQSKTHIMISCENYIDQMVRAHSWEQLPNKTYDFIAKTPSPLLDKCLNEIFAEDGLTKILLLPPSLRNKLASHTVPYLVK